MSRPRNEDAFWQRYSGADWSCCVEPGCLMPAVYSIDVPAVGGEEAYTDHVCSKHAGDPSEVDEAVRWFDGIEILGREAA